MINEQLMLDIKTTWNFIGSTISHVIKSNDHKSIMFVSNNTCHIVHISPDDGKLDDSWLHKISLLEWPITELADAGLMTPEDMNKLIRMTQAAKDAEAGKLLSLSTYDVNRLEKNIDKYITVGETIV